MSPDTTGKPTVDELKAKGFQVQDGMAPDDKLDAGQTKITPPDKPGEPGKYDGKSEEDLRKMLTEQDKHIGEMSGKIDQFKGDSDYWRNKADAIDRERQLYAQTMVNKANQPVDQSAADKPQFNWEKPLESVDTQIDRKLEERDRFTSQARIVESIDDAKMAFQDGFKRAVRENPRLFEGDTFQDEVADFMYNYYEPFAKKGMPVSRYVGNPDVWKKVAQNKRLDKQEFDHLQPDKVSPVSPTATNIPAGGKLVGSEDEPVHLEQGAKEMVDWFKTKGYVKGEEEVAELIRDERKGRAELEE